MRTYTSRRTLVLHLREGKERRPRQVRPGGSWRCLDVDGKSCADTKLVPSWRVGDRSGETAIDFRQRSAPRPPWSTEDSNSPVRSASKAYLEAGRGRRLVGDVDYAQLIKLYGSEGVSPSDKRYSCRMHGHPPAPRRWRSCNPDSSTTSRPATVESHNADHADVCAGSRMLDQRLRVKEDADEPYPQPWRFTSMHCSTSGRQHTSLDGDQPRDVLAGVHEIGCEISRTSCGWWTKRRAKPNPRGPYKKRNLKLTLTTPAPAVGHQRLDPESTPPNCEPGTNIEVGAPDALRANQIASASSTPPSLGSPARSDRHRTLRACPGC